MWKTSLTVRLASICRNLRPTSRIRTVQSRKLRTTVESECIKPRFYSYLEIKGVTDSPVRVRSHSSWNKVNRRRIWIGFETNVESWWLQIATRIRPYSGSTSKTKPSRGTSEIVLPTLELQVSWNIRILYSGWIQRNYNQIVSNRPNFLGLTHLQKQLGAPYYWLTSFSGSNMGVRCDPLRPTKSSGCFERAMLLWLDKLIRS